MTLATNAVKVFGSQMTRYDEVWAWKLQKVRMWSLVIFAVSGLTWVTRCFSQRKIWAEISNFTLVDGYQAAMC